MAMTSFNISLSDTMKEYVESRVSQGDYGTPSDFVRSLIRRDKERRIAALEDELLEALDSGVIEVSQDELTGGNLVEILRARSA
ncbi:antitoxin ParD1/3/4 [Granulicella rosea]|uniref:Antitoxin ParD1/3/4 n=1 Tax=Granulicella rosea TaxID=474952 RepID=A0A239DFI9_9BACT|nr:type II toxin-antitoxin system ParD family antitoxin [Granulicella rosea]SNS31047.1 antitoxin ParD1/3/4 [Granulicella rosea]